MKKKSVAILSLILALAIIMVGCSNKNNKEGKDTPAVSENQNGANNSQETGDSNDKLDDYVVRLTYTGSLCQAPLQLAYELGYFDEEGVKVEFIKSEQAAADLMVSGKLDVYQDMIPKIVQQVDNGLNIKIVSGVHTGCLKALTLATNDEINSIKDLKGKKIGVPGLASSQAVIVQRTLLEYGIGATPDNMEVEFVVYNASDLQMALENGYVDAICIADPAASKIVESGVGKLIFDQSSDPLYEDEYCCVLVFSPEFIEKHPEIAKMTLKAIQKACIFVEENPEEAAKLQIEKNYVAGDVELNSRLLKSYNYNPSIEGAKDSVYKNVVALQKLGLISNDLSPEAVLDKIFYEIEGIE